MNTVLKLVNQKGIPCIDCIGITVGTTSAVFSFAPHRFVNDNFSGYFVARIVQTFTAPTVAVPIVFTTTGISNSTVELKTYDNTAVDTSTWPGTGFHTFFYDRESNTLQLVS